MGISHKTASAVVPIVFGNLTPYPAVIKKKDVSGYRKAGKDKSESGVQGVSET